MKQKYQILLDVEIEILDEKVLVTEQVKKAILQMNIGGGCYVYVNKISCVEGFSLTFPIICK